MDILLIKMVISILYLYILHTNTTSNVKKYSMQDIAILLQNIFATFFLLLFYCFALFCFRLFIFFSFVAKYVYNSLFFFAVYLCKYDIILFTLE
jgi:hypothetical protein